MRGVGRIEAVITVRGAYEGDGAVTEVSEVGTHTSSNAARRASWKCAGTRTYSGATQICPTAISPRVTPECETKKHHTPGRRSRNGPTGSALLLFVDRSLGQ